MYQCTLNPAIWMVSRMVKQLLPAEWMVSKMVKWFLPAEWMVQLVAWFPGWQNGCYLLNGLYRWLPGFQDAKWMLPAEWMVQMVWMISSMPK